MWGAGIMRRLMLIVAACICAPSIAFAQNWVVTGSDVDQTQYEADTTSVHLNGGFVNAWVRITKRRNEWDAVGHKWYRYGLLQMIYDCAANSSADTAWIKRDSQVGRRLPAQSHSPSGR